MDESEDNLQVEEEPEAPTSPSIPSPPEGLSPQQGKEMQGKQTKQNCAEKKWLRRWNMPWGFLIGRTLQNMQCSSIVLNILDDQRSDYIV